MQNLSPKYSNSYKYLLRLLSSVILNTQPPKPNEETDWALVFHCAKEHSVFGMLSYAVEKLPKEYKPSAQMMSELLQIQRSELILESNIQFETDRLLAEFTSRGLSAVLLKGMILKNYYPVSSMRTMTDVDILYNVKEKSAVKNIFKSLDYKLEIDLDSELHYRKMPFHYYEMHPFLVSRSRDTFDFFSTAWDNLFKLQGSQAKTLNLEYTYIYMIDHLAKHIEKAGAGLRLLMDVFVFLRKEKDNLNSQFIDESLEKLKLKEFSDKICALSENWFTSADPDTESISAQFILSSSTFGIVDNAILQTNIRNERKSGKKQNGFKYLTRKIFPGYKHICARFPSARKLKILYPFYIPAYWCLRLFKDRNVNTSNIGKYFTKTDSDKAKYLLSVMDEFSLSDRI